MMTIKQLMEDNLWSMRKLEPDDVFQAMPVIIRQINEESHYYTGLAHKDNPEQKTFFKDCWDMDENIFTEETIDALWMLVKDFAFSWCVAKINSMK